MAMVFGRPRIINANDCNIKLPIDCNIPEDPSKIVPTVAHPIGDNDEPSSFSSYLFYYSLSQLAHEMRATGASSHCPRDYSAIQDFHDRVVSLLDAVPLILRPKNPDTSWDTRCPDLPLQREQVLTTANSFLLALHRPNIHIYPESRKRALEAALVTLESQQRFFEKVSRHHYKFFGLSFFTINAAFFLAAVTMIYPPTDPEFKQEVYLGIRHAIDRLVLLENRNAIAGPGLKLLRHCYQQMQDSSRPDTGLAVLEPLVGGTAQPQIPKGGGSNQGGNAHELPFAEGHSQLAALDPSHIFQQHVAVPIGMDGAEIPNINEFDESYWIEQMNQVPGVPMDDPNLSMLWDSFFG
jgi:hypothetical protein